MFHSLVAVLLTVGLGGGFGDASAEVVSIGSESMLISVEVEANSSAESVVASFFAPGDGPVTLPLLHRGGNVYGLQTELRPVDYAVVFEILGPEPARSDRISLSAMGAVFGAQSVTTTDPVEEDEQGFSTDAKRWGWLALALTASSLAVLAFWVLGGRDRDGSESNGGDSGEESTDAVRDEETDASGGDDPAGESR
jgi:hypothetical protein